MLFTLSILLVFGALAVFVGNMNVSEQGQLGFGFEQMIHARVPWLLLAPPLIGAALGSSAWYVRGAGTSGRSFRSRSSSPGSSPGT